MDPTRVETALKHSVQRFLKTALPTDVPVVCADDYQSVTQEMSGYEHFVAFRIGDGSVFPRLSRELQVFSLSRSDPGNLKLDATLGIIASKLRHLGNVTMYDGEDQVTQLVVQHPQTRRLVIEDDRYKSKSIVATVTTVIP